MASAIHCFKIHKNLFTPEEKKALRTESRKLAMEKKIKPQEAMVRVVKLRIADLQEEYNKIEAVIKKHMVPEKKAPEKKAPEKKAVSHIELVKRYVKETGKKVEKGELDKVKERYPTEWAKIEKAEAHKKELWNKLPESFRRNRGINEYTTEELEVMVAEIKPLVVDEESYLAQKGAGRQAMGEAALHKNIQPGIAKERALKRQAEKDRALIALRDELREEYKAKIKIGELRAPTRIEVLIETAKGHPDIEATRAARRLLERRGVEWDTEVKFSVADKGPVYVRRGSLTDEVLGRMNKYLKSLGYDIKGKQDIYQSLKGRTLDDGTKLKGMMDSKTREIKHPDWADAYEGAMGGIEVRKKKLKIKKEVRISAVNVEWDRIRELGKTADIREAGYITPEGDLIDLSGKREGGTPGMRSYDHREAGGTLGMQEYMALGNIRMNASAGTFDILVEPTPAQYKKIDELVRLHRGKLVVDLGEGLGEQGDTYYSNPDRTFGNEYPKGTTLSEIKNDIERFYAGEEVKPVARPVLFSRIADMYSALTRAAEAPKFPANIPAKSVINQLKKAPGVKQVELEVSGLLEWLEGKGRVLKADLVDFLRMTEVRVEEVERGITKSKDPIEWRKYLVGNMYLSEQEADAMSNNEIIGVASEEMEAGNITKEDFAPTKFAEHALPGGEPGSYRELVLRVPGKYQETSKEYDTFVAKIKEKYGEENPYDARDQGLLSKKEIAEFEVLEKKFRNVIEYRSTHWPGDVNVVAHIRGDARMAADGKRRFHVAEFQSDIYSRIVELEAEKAQHEEALKRTKPDAIDLDVFARAQKGLQLRYDGISKELANLKKLFPWGESWHELVAKKALEYAVKNDFDGISWDTGKTQVDRWESALRKSVDKIDWSKGWRDGEDAHISGVKDGGQVFMEQVPLQGETTINGQGVTLNNLIGKELATKIRESSENSGTFEGKDLTIGGEFYKILYDQRIPGFLKKYGKKWEAKVEGGQVDTFIHLHKVVEETRGKEAVRPQLVKVLHHNHNTRHA